MNEYSRVTGLVSNLDTDGLVKNMMKIETMKLDKVKAEKQLLEWKQENYREFTSLLKGMESSYFDLLNKDENLTLASSFQATTPKITVDGKSSSAISVRYLNNSKSEDIKIKSIKKLATSEVWTSMEEINKIGGEVKPEDLKTAFENASNKVMTISVNGIKKNIQLEDNYLNASDEFDINAFNTDLQNKLNEAFGENMVQSSLTTEAGTTSIKINSLGNKVIMGDADADILNGLGIKTGDKNYVSLNDKLDQFNLFENSSSLSFKINGSKEITINSDDTIGSMIKKINKGQSVATLRIDDISGKFIMKHKNTGFANTIEPDADGMEFFKKIGLLTDNPSDTITRGENAEIVLENGQTIINDKNRFKIGSARVTINSTYNKTEDPSVSAINIHKEFNAKDITEKVVGFVKKYNEMIDKIRKATRQKTTKYKPLTDEQKKAMEKDDIENWEKKAKEGLLKNDRGLEKIISDLRNVVNSKVEGVDITLKDMGISFTSNFQDGGKLVIDKTKFTAAMEERGEEVVEFMTKKSETEYSETSTRAKRFSENGFMQRIKDVIKDNISTTKNSSGRRGYLVEKAGVKGLSSEKDNDISKIISREYNKKISRMMDLLKQKENSYYMQFARLESMMSKLTEQQNSFMGLMG